ncbi:armadillo-type protein [Mycena olivaceomarginata]|nr:armadillo-type protein [Mycena olivaceomarginata]
MNGALGRSSRLLLLVVPLRDFLSSILDIQEKVEEKRRIQGNFEERLRGGVEGGTVEAEIFKDLIERGADPTVGIEGALPVKNLLELAASRGNEDLVRYLQEVGVEDKDGRAFFAAVWNKHFVTASLLKDGNKSYMAVTFVRPLQAAIKCISSLAGHEQLQAEIRATIPSVVRMSGDSDGRVRQAAIQCISSLAGQKQLQAEIRAAIPSVVKMFEDSEWRVRVATIQCISSLPGQEQLQPEIRAAIPSVVKLLEHSDSDVRQAAIECTWATLQAEIRAAIPSVVKMFEDSEWRVRVATIQCISSLPGQGKYSLVDLEAFPILMPLSRTAAAGDPRRHSQRLTFVRPLQAAIKCISSLAGHEQLQAEIRATIPSVVRMSGDSDGRVRQAAIQCISSLAGQKQLQAEIRAAIPSVVKMFEDSEWRVRVATIQCISSLPGQEQLQPEIRAAIPSVVKLLEHSDSDVRQAAIECTWATLQPEIRAAIPSVVKLLHSDSDVREAAIECISSLVGHVTFVRPRSSAFLVAGHEQLQAEIRAAIPSVVKMFEDSDWRIRYTAIQCISSLAGHEQLQAKIRAAIPSVVRMSGDSDGRVRQAAIQCISSLAGQSKYSLVDLEVFPILMPLSRTAAAGDPRRHSQRRENVGRFQP